MTYSRAGILMLLLGAAFVFASCSSDGITGVPTVDLEISVLDEALQPMAGAVVTVFNDCEYAAVTSADGKCYYSGLLAIDTAVRVRGEGYGRVYDMIALEEGSQSATYSLELLEEFFEDFESGTFSSEWTLLGDGDWTITASESHGGLRSAESPLLGNGEQCSIRTTVEVGSDLMTLRFWYKLETDYYDHYFEFYVNDERQVQQSGSYDWREYEMEFHEGIYVLEWVLNNRDTGNTDSRVWVDDITFTE